MVYEIASTVAVDLFSAQTVEQIKVLLAKDGVDKEQKNVSGFTPLLWAIAFKRTEVAKELIHQKANVNAAIPNGCTALHAAAETGNAELIQLLVESNADIEKKDVALTGSPMVIACQFKQLESVKKLLELGAELDSKTQKNGCTPLLLAVDTGAYEIAQYLLEKGANVNIQEETNGLTPLISAVMRDNQRMVELVLKYNPNLEIKEKQTQTTALYVACRNPVDRAIVKLLIDAKADITSTNPKGATPLYAAVAAKQEVETLKLLIDANSDVNINIGGFTPLTVAAEQTNLSALKYLMDAGAIVSDIPENQAAILLTYVLKKDKEQLFDQLISKSIALNGTNAKGIGLLMFTLLKNKVKYLKKLVDAGIDVNKKSIGMTTISLAAEEGNEEMVDLLLAKGAKADDPSDDGSTPIMCACNTGKLEMVKKLLSLGANINTYSKDIQENALFNAAAQSHWDIVDYLADLHFEKKISLNVSNLDATGQSIYHFLLSKLFDLVFEYDDEHDKTAPCNSEVHGKYTRVLQLLYKYLPHEDFGTVSQVVCKKGFTLVMYAALIKDAPLACKIFDSMKEKGSLQKMIDFQYETEEELQLPIKGTTPLYQTVLSKDSHEMSELLVKYGADIRTIVTSSNITSLFAAVQTNQSKIVEIMLLADKERRESSGDQTTIPIINQIMPNKGTLLSVAAGVGNLEMVELLLKHSADVNLEGSISPVVTAVSLNNLPILKLLIEAGADVNQKDIASHAPAIYMAIQSKNEEIFNYMLSKGANISFQVEANGFTPLTYACQLKLESFVSSILQSFPPEKQEEKKAYLELREKSVGGTALYVATQANSLQLAQLLLEHSAFVDPPSIPQLFTPLLYASQMGYYDLIELFLSKGADINHKSHENATPLHYALMNNHKRVVDLFLSDKYKGIIDITPKTTTNGSDPFLTAVACSHPVEVIKRLLEFDADVNSTNAHGMGCLSLAVLRDSHQVFNYLIECKANVCNTSIEGITPLHIAAEKENTQDFIKTLLDNNADVNPLFGGRTPAFCAGSVGNIQIMQYLISHNGNTNCTDNSLLFQVALNASLTLKEDFLLQLLKNKADPNTKREGGESLLHFTAKSNAIRIVKILLEHNADCSVKSDEDSTPLADAISKGFYQVAELFLNAGADMNEKKGGYPLLCVAAQLNQVTMLKLLLSKGVDIESCNEETGETALFLACQSGHKAAVKFLIKKGANVNAPNKDGDTPLMIATQKGHSKIITILLQEKTLDNLATNKNNLTAAQLGLEFLQKTYGFQLPK